MLGLFLALGLGACAVATDDAGSPEPTASDGQGLTCATLLCMTGTVCQEHGNSARCVKPKREKATDPCATAKCMAGYHCEPKGQSAECVLDCAVEECGPALGMPNTLCDDGTVAGPTGNCISSNGQCVWEVLYCP
jgi:hypothetical protein